MKICEHCDSENKKNNKFCDNCGRPIQEDVKDRKNYKVHLCGTTQLDPIGKI